MMLLKGGHSTIKGDSTHEMGEGDDPLTPVDPFLVLDGAPPSVAISCSTKRKLTHITKDEI